MERSNNITLKIIDILCFILYKIFMKKIITIIMMAFVMVNMFFVATNAAETDTVIKVEYESEVKEFNVFEDGWNYAMERAKEGKDVYVTLLTDWKAEDGQFTKDFINGPGFDYDTIYFADDVKMTLDLNGFTIDRGLTSAELNGEVIFINDDANVTIKNGTITGGYSSNGAGGIHMEDAIVHLENLVFTNNRVRNDDGAALQHNDGGELYMKNCRFENNDCENKGFDIYGTVYLDDVDKVYIEDCYFSSNDGIDYGAGIYLNDCAYTEIKNCTFENLYANDRGGAIWASGNYENHILDIVGCKFLNNSAGNWAGAIYAELLLFNIYDSEFKGNSAEWSGGAIYYTGTNAHQGRIDSYIYRSTFDGNYAGWDAGAIYCNGNMMTTGIYSYGCTFINNRAEGSGGAVYCETECKFALFSDENGDPAIVKNNVAGEDGGGIYSPSTQGISGYIHIGGEVYVSGNTSANGNDDLYISSSSGLSIHEITSPAGSIGVRSSDDESGSVGRFVEDVEINIDSFFINNEGFEVGYKIYTSSSTENHYLMLVEIPSHAGSIFGEGSFVSIISLLALIASITSFGIGFVLYKKVIPVLATEEESNEDNE